MDNIDMWVLDDLPSQVNAISAIILMTWFTIRELRPAKQESYGREFWENTL